MDPLPCLASLKIKSSDPIGTPWNELLGIEDEIQEDALQNANDVIQKCCDDIHTYLNSQSNQNERILKRYALNIGISLKSAYEAVLVKNEKYEKKMINDWNLLCLAPTLIDRPPFDANCYSHLLKQHPRKLIDLRLIEYASKEASMNCEDMENAQPWPVFVVSIDEEDEGEDEGEEEGGEEGEGEGEDEEEEEEEEEEEDKQEDETYQESDTGSQSDTRKQPGTRSSVVITPEEARGLRDLSKKGQQASSGSLNKLYAGNTAAKKPTPDNKKKPTKKPKKKPVKKYVNAEFAFYYYIHWACSSDSLSTLPSDDLKDHWSAKFALFWKQVAILSRIRKLYESEGKAMISYGSSLVVSDQMQGRSIVTSRLLQIKHSLLDLQKNTPMMYDMAYYLTQRIYERAVEPIRPRNTQNGADGSTMNLLIIGESGIGKTSSIRRLRSIWYNLGMISIKSSEDITLVNAQALQGQYVGRDTFDRIEKYVLANVGGVLVIDEMYQLANASSQGYTKQVLEGLLSLLEEWYGLIIVVGMGYKKEMHTMLNVNSGMQRRFQATLELNSYTTESAIEIIKSGMKSSNAAPSRSNLINTEVYNSLFNDSLKWLLRNCYPPQQTYRTSIFLKHADDFIKFGRFIRIHQELIVNKISTTVTVDTHPNNNVMQSALIEALLAFIQSNASWSGSYREDATQIIQSRTSSNLSENLLWELIKDWNTYMNNLSPAIYARRRGSERSPSSSPSSSSSSFSSSFLTKRPRN